MEQLDIGVELATLKGQLSTLMGSLQRIEEAVSQIISIDKSVNTMQMQIQHFDKELTEHAHNIKSLMQLVRSQNDLMLVRVNDIDREFRDFKSTTNGVLLMLKLFSGFAAAVIIGIGGWVYTRLDSSTTTNIEQTHRINGVERDMSDLTEVLRRLDKRLDKLKDAQ